jgi:hypothetical protein
VLVACSNSPIGDRTVEFAFQDSLSNILCRAQTDTTGLAQCNFFPAQPILTSRNFQATFQGTLCLLLFVLQVEADLLWTCLWCVI